MADLANAQNRAGNLVGIACDSGPYTAYSEAILRDLDNASAYGVKRLRILSSLSTGDLPAYHLLLEWIYKKHTDFIQGYDAKDGAYVRMLAYRLNMKSVYKPHRGVLHYHAPQYGRIAVTGRTGAEDR